MPVPAPDTVPEAPAAQALTLAQAGIWYAQQRTVDSPSHNCAQYVELTGPLDVTRFEAALRATVAEADVLSLRYREPSGDRAEPVAEQGAPDGGQGLVDACDQPDPHAFALEWMGRDLARPRDLARDPVFTHAVLRTGPERHLWYFACHHIAVDSYAVTLLQQRVAELYGASVRGERRPPVRFGDPRALLTEEREYRDSPRHEEDRAYFTDLLARWTPPADLRPAAPERAAGSEGHMEPAGPTAPAGSDGRRDAVVSDAGDAPQPPWFRRAHGPLAATAGAAGAEERLAVVAAYLHRVTAREDVVLGLPYAGRLGSAAARVPANTVNVLPLVLTVRPGATLRELTAQVRERLRELRRHARYRGEDIRRDLRVPVGEALTGPLVNVGLRTPELAFEGLAARVVHLSAGPVDDLTITFRDHPADGFATLTLDAAPDRYPDAALRAHHRRLRDVAAVLTADPDRPIGLVPMVSEEERAAVPELSATTPQHLLSDLPDPADSPVEDPASGTATLAELFHRRATADPAAVAVVFGHLQLTYGDLEERANRLAHELRARGIGRESLVALALPRSAHLVVAVLAVLKAGAGYVPLDPHQPPARTAAVLAAARPALLLTDSTSWTRPDAERAAADATPPLVLDAPAVRAALARHPATPPEVPGAGADDCAYVIHTSGSTGLPKGVVVPHRNVVRLLDTTDALFGFGPADTWTLFHSYAFDFSVWELFGALLRGGRLVVVPYAVSRSPADFLRLLAKERVTVLNQTPTAFEQLTAAEAADPATGARLTLRHVIFGGEPLRPAALADWYRRHPEDAPRLTNMYGITETTVHVTQRLLGPQDTAPGATGLIGTALPDLRVRLLDPALCPVPPGATGELYVAGPGLARGYLGSPGLTAARFLPDPYGPPGARMYRSGDLARRCPDGRLDHLGRADQQIKLRGFRIEPGEIEAALLSHPGVAQCAVVLRHPGTHSAPAPAPISTSGSDSGEPALAAYAVPRHGITGAPDPAELRRHVAALLPAPMVPATFTLLPALPLTPNGKLDASALPAPQASSGGAADSRPPTGPHEGPLCALIAELLGLAHVGPDDDFFALGGHSLLATRLVGRARHAFGAELGVRDIFEAPTAARLAARLAGRAEQARATSTEGAEEVPALRPPLTAVPGADRPAPLPLSDAQRRIWFLHRMEGPSPTYNIPYTVRLSGTLDRNALRAALADLVTRHESLRTVFPVAHGADAPHGPDTGQAEGSVVGPVDGEPVQQVLPPSRAVPELHVTDLSGERDRAMRLDAALAAASRFAFDLAAHPPLHVRLFRLAPDEHVLLLLVHHIACDDWSLAPLGTDLAEAYAARRTGHAPAWPALPVQYADYTLWHTALTAADSELAQRQLEFWRTQLSGLPDQIELPSDRRRPPVASHRGATVPVRIDAALHDTLRRLARRHGATVFMTLHAALAALLTRLGAGTDLAIGTPVAGRTDHALDELVGFFANSLVLRTDTSGDPSFAELLDRVRATDLAAFDHQDVPFERLVEEVSPVRSPARHPLFQVMLSYGTARRAPALPGIEAERLHRHNGSAKFDLTLSLSDAAPSTPAGATEAPGIDGFLEYATDLFDADSARALVERLLRLLRQVLAAPEAPIGRHELLSHAERDRIVRGWNDTEAPVDPRPFPVMFEQQAAAHPARTALVAGEHRLTYRELNVLANRLAHRLAELGVGPERTVGIHLPRGAELVIGLLAVQKAGGAFVPMEPSWPADRLAQIAASAAPVAVLTRPGDTAALPEGVPAVELALSEGELDAWFPKQPECDPGVRIAPENLSYVIHTSGSTGVPKGAMIRHRAISNRLPWQIGLLGLTPDDPVLHKAPLTFDISVNEIFLPLACGAPLVVADAGREGDVAYLLDLVRAERIAFVYLVSSVLDIMLEHPDAAASGASLKHVWCGGEVLTPELFRRFRACLGAATMYHGYGPAETTIGVTCQVYRGTADHGITIGRPNPNARVYILDAAMQPVPAGVPGELFIGGVPLGRGYLGEARRTAQSFVPDPFSGQRGGRLYRSGDLARHRPDGNIEFLGRADNQVKIRGVRVELEEIESLLTAHPDVRQAAVVVRRGAGGEQLTAWCTPRAEAGTPPTSADLAEWLRTKLPEYLVPRHCTVLPALPLLTSGKVDRKALAATEPPATGPGSGSGTGRATPAVPPAEGTEQVVAAAWESALGLAAGTVGAHDNFFDLGGHSLLLARVQTRLRAHLGWDVPVLDLFTRPTPAALAAHLDSRDGHAPASATARGTGARAALGQVLPIRTEGPLPPLFCLPPASGLSWPFTGLRRHIDERRPLYGLQSRALLGELPVLATLEETAREYLTRVREVQPNGPYHLVGWSFGGVLAHTIAAALQEQGERVALLAMLDSYPAYPWERLAADHEQQALRSLLYMSHYDLSQLDEGAPLTRARVMETIARQGGVLSELSERSLQGVMDTFVAAGRQQRTAHHPVLDGDLLFFTATVNQLDPSLSHRDWQPYVRGTVENHPIACEHKDMTRSGPLAEIGRHLDRRLTDAV
ncbi:amino acid adenylation domain-containing protein [Streptomyces sp. NPDC094437]|uniref:amino acid adenylation domain-containing protein n=1 Tax=Streptomyces sp. NPDC094437 TaxID=3366060 RepID=UPI0037FB8C68